MADSNIVITSTSPQGKVLQKTLTDINPAATNAQLATFGTMLNALTDNQYGKTVKITKVHCDAEAGGGDTRPVPTLQIWNAQKTEVITTANSQNGQSLAVYIKYTGDGKIFTSVDTRGCAVRIAEDLDQNNYAGTFLTIAGDAGTDIVFTFMTPETDNYQAASVTLTVTVV